MIVVAVNTGVVHVMKGMDLGPLSGRTPPHSRTRLCQEVRAWSAMKNLQNLGSLSSRRGRSWSPSYGVR
jgi:hypothetical protein